MNNSKILLIFFACLVIVFVVTKMIDYHEKKLEDGAVNNGNLFNGKISNILQVVKKNVNKMGESIKKTSSQSEDDGECFMKPDFSKENYTEFMRKRLVVDLAKFKNERRNLKGKCGKEKYIWNTKLFKYSNLLKRDISMFYSTRVRFCSTFEFSCTHAMRG